MRPKDFLQLSESEQTEHLQNRGRLVLDPDPENAGPLIYALDCFFVELRFDAWGNQKSLTTYQVIPARYLDPLPLGDLLQ